MTVQPNHHLEQRRPSEHSPFVDVNARHEVAAGPSMVTRILRRLGRLALAVRYRLTQSHRHRRLTLEYAAGNPILVSPDVFNPVLFKTGAFLAESLNERLIPPGSTVLDMGTGSGVGAVAAARWAAHVVATDINPEAVRCAKINLLLNKLDDRAEVRHGDLFEPVAADERRFDVVLFNPPYFRGEPLDDYDRAWRSDDVVERFAANLRRYLSDDGVAYVVLSTDGDSPEFLGTFRGNHYTIEVVERRQMINETLTIYAIRMDRG